MTAALPPLHSRARRRIGTARLWLLAPEPDATLRQATAVADFLQRNQAHFARWDPPRPPDDDEPEAVQARLATSAAAFAADQAWRWWLALAEDPQRVVGGISLSNLARGPSQSCSLGYSLDAACEGRGLMQEALRAVIAEAFAPGINLHRLQAGVRPENTRSLAVLARLGFVDEGLARDYLFIDGGWRDHRIFSLSNPDFIAPAHW